MVVGDNINFISLAELTERYTIQETDLSYVSGGSLRTIKALDKNNMEDVFLKFSNIDDGELESYISNFLRVKNLVHPNIVGHKGIYRLYRPQFGFSLLEVFEFANHGPLSDFLRSPRRFGEIIKLFRQALTGVDYLHKNSILHRDIKATNFVVSGSEGGYIAKVCDIEFLSSASRLGTISTPEYLAPEVTTFESYDIQSEVWAVGIMIYEIFTGEFPFGSRLRGNTIEEIRERAHCVEKVAAATTIPQPFRDLVAHSLVKDKKLRFKNVGEMVKRLGWISVLLQLMVSKLKKL